MSMNSRWHYYNPNPDTRVYTRGRRKGRRRSHGDCVVRAFTILFDCDWKDAYIQLALRGMSVGDVFNQKEVWSTFLQQVKDFDLKVPDYDLFSDKDYHLKSVSEVAAELESEGKPYLCHTLHHVVIVKGGEYWDSWDCGLEPVRSLWKLDEKSANCEKRFTF